MQEHETSCNVFCAGLAALWNLAVRGGTRNAVCLSRAVLLLTRVSCWRAQKQTGSALCPKAVSGCLCGA